MQVVRKKLMAISGVLILLSMVSCKKWVNDAPQPLQVDESVVFSTEQGFREALNGVYLQMGDSTLYGRFLTTGVLSVLGRSYDRNIPTSEIPDKGRLIYQSARYNLQDTKVKTYCAELWNKMYKSIANLNNILVNIEAKKGIFTGNNYNTFKGEALALRAYLHFDLLRLFAEAPAKGGLSTLAIPYVTTINSTATTTSTVEQVLDLCIVDLKAAEELLANTSLITSQLNVWSAKGLLARVYLYKGDVNNAKIYADAVINSNKFSLTKTNTNYNSLNLFFIDESLFKLYVYQNEFRAFQRELLSGTTGLGFTPANQTALYGSITPPTINGDWRKSFVDYATGNNFPATNAFVPKKIYSTYANAFPMVRLSEMYYISAESAVNSGDATTAKAMLDSVRVHRGLPILTSPQTLANLNDEITKEYQKEFIIEGQMFFYFKRKNIPFASLPFTIVPVAPNATYTFVKPQ